MSLSIKRSSNAPTLEGVSQGTSYPVFALTHDHAVILSDDEKLLAVSFKSINAGEVWSVVADKLKKDELPEEEKRKAKK